MTSETLSLPTLTNIVSLASLGTGALTADVIQWNGATWTSAALPTTYADSLFRLYNTTTTTKRLAFDLSNIAAATTRTTVAPNANTILSAVNPGTSTNSLYTGTIPFASVMTGSGNAIYGLSAGIALTSSSNTTLCGYNAGSSLTTGAGNTFLGAGAGNTTTIGANNIIIGYNTLTTAIDTNQEIRIGFGGTSYAKCFIDGIRGKTTGAVDGIAVLVDSNGQLGTVSSSARYKDDIQSLPTAQVASLFNLEPKSFYYKSDPSKKKTYGLIAEEVEKILPDAVVHIENPDEATRAETPLIPETVQYHLLIPLLLAMCKQLKQSHDALQQSHDALQQSYENFVASHKI